MKSPTKQEIATDIYNLYWYDERNEKSFLKLCTKIEKYCKLGRKE